AIVERAGDKRYGAVRLETNAAHLLVGRRCHLQVAADRYAAQLAAFAAVALALGKALPVGEVERMAEYRGEVSRIVDLSGGCRIRDFRGLDEVTAAQLDAVDAHFARRSIDQALHEIIGLRAAGAPVGADIGRVGEHALSRDLDQRRAIDADHVL